MTFDARKDRTELRLRLYQNGYEPLANKSKMCVPLQKALREANIDAPGERRSGAYSQEAVWRKRTSSPDRPNLPEAVALPPPD